jgi:hypothetical protein
LTCDYQGDDMQIGIQLAFSYWNAD